MEKLYNYLSKKEITYSRETFGNSNYFYNAPNYTYSGAFVTVDHLQDKEAEKKERLLRAYCNRYGYSIQLFNSNFCKHHYIIVPDAIRKAADNYNFFLNASLKECEEKAHELYIEGRPDEVNEALGQIMNKYGELYKESLLFSKTA